MWNRDDVDGAYICDSVAGIAGHAHAKQKCDSHLCQRRRLRGSPRIQQAQRQGVGPIRGDFSWDGFGGTQAALACPQSCFCDVLWVRSYFFANGDRFEGEFKMGVKDGFGTYFYKSGSVYSGSFRGDSSELGTTFLTCGIERECRSAGVQLWGPVCGPVPQRREAREGEILSVRWHSL